LDQLRDAGLVTDEKYPASSVHPGGRWDDVTEEILLLLKDMDLEKRREVLRYLQEKKLLTDLMQERGHREKNNDC